MQFGVDEHGQRIEPFKNGRSVCPLCGNVLIAHCGDINAWHWHHYKAIDCDSWKEPETAWHLNWKKRWAGNEREVIIEKDGKKHIADIQNKNGIVIEFQNSPISMSTISARETFYGKMFWVINAKNFMEHLNIWSLVTKELKELEEDNRKSLAMDSYFYRTEMEEFRKKIAKKEREIRSTKEQLSSAKFHMESYFKNPEQITAVALASMAKWDEMKNGYEEANYYSIYDLTNYFKEYRAHQRTQKSLAVELEQIEKAIHKINIAPPYQAGNILYKILAFQEIVQLKCVVSIAIPIQEQHSMFPIFNAVRSLEQLVSYQHKQAGFLFAIDPVPLLEKLNYQKESVQSKIAEANNTIPDYQTMVISKVKAYYVHNYELTKKHFDGWQKQLDKYNSELSDLTDEMESFNQAEQIVIESSREESEKQLEEDRSHTMRRWKGLYGFRWKNERKSWSETGSPVFFDIGKDYLFQRTGPKTLRKVSLAIFLNKYNPPGASSMAI
ncbi:competence protein CoiA [Mucilaginibacter sp. X5P1]|uniref:competence protein CoiA n=1 Tax=Mucilaginibacter sp. X5P1 TaxID=2723088 RepID=UPI00161D78C7|nr:competence protein CoiA family protein [Mucilaginibacter sp. X5P1]MBB6141719.1 competence CoiA-like predicted nuclease [Mucilaginibacter sp. X5P1]